MKWYRAHLRQIIFITVLILLVSITAASYLNRGNNSWIGRHAESVISFLQEPFSNAGDGIVSTVKGIFQFSKIQDENQMLKEENAKLRQEVIKQALSQDELAELRKLSAMMNYESPTYRNVHVAATVIAMDLSAWYRVFTINEGFDKGINKDDVVINADGLIGRVMEVGSDWAKVISIIDEKNNVSFQVFRDLDLLGVVQGDGKGMLTGYMLDAEASVTEGDVLVTSGMELYPQGIPVGKISEVYRDKDALLQTVSVEPAVNFHTIKKVSVILKAE